MSGLLLLLLGTLLFTGLYLLMAQALGFEKRTVRRNRQRLIHKENTLKAFFERIQAPLAERIAKHINLPDYARTMLYKDLGRANMQVTPEHYYGLGISKGILCSACCAPLFLLGIPLLGFGVLILGILLGMKELETVKTKLKKQNVEIQRALPAFVRTITESLKSDRNLR